MPATPTENAVACEKQWDTPARKGSAGRTTAGFNCSDWGWPSSRKRGAENQGRGWDNNAPTFTWATPTGGKAGLPASLPRRFNQGRHGNGMWQAKT